jgi:hypothetical protein
MRLKGRHFETVFDVQRESQAVLDSIKENDFTVFLKRGKNNGIAIYIPNETILKEMAAKLSKLSQHFFFVLVRELSDRTSYMNQVPQKYMY